MKRCDTPLGREIRSPVSDSMREFLRPEIIDSEHEEAAIHHLREKGYTVEKPIDPDSLQWETPGQLAKRLKVLPSQLSRDMHNPRRPKVELETHQSGRVRRIASNPQFEAFVKAARPGSSVRASEVSKA